MNELKPYMEIDCEKCGIDYDVQIGATHCPGCNMLLSEEIRANSNKYNADGSLE